MAELKQKIASGTKQIDRVKVTDSELIFTSLQKKNAQFMSLRNEDMALPFP
ncbi:hypothetical protein QUA30_24050 [Microcoleus sp. Pol14C2]|uniref:hypothetical protein n=1 Tax=unclassified Microcoleus TaxID=2642155 RepID=UPI002FD64F1C